MFETAGSGTLTGTGWLVMICGIGVVSVAVHLAGAWLRGRAGR